MIEFMNIVLIKYRELEYSQYITALLIFFVFFLAKKIFEKFIYKNILRGFEKTKSEFAMKFWENFKNPIGRIILLVGIYSSLHYVIAYKLDPSIAFRADDDFFLKIVKALIVIQVASGFYNLVDRDSKILTKIKGITNIEASKILEPFISKIIRFIIIVIATSAIAELFGYSMDTIVAGLGIGGVAIALAAQDTLSNLLGGVIILMDKPFDIDDWINCNGIEGIVEDISFRSTRIRTFEKELIYVPNAIMAKEPISNFSKRGLRRARFKIGLTYNTTSSQMKACVNAISLKLASIAEIDEKTVVVKFEGFNDSSLDILVMYFVKTTEYNKYMSIREQVNLFIMDIVENQELSMAFPSTSLYFENRIPK